MSVFNTVNGIRVHAILYFLLCWLNYRSFNTVNGIRVHAMNLKPIRVKTCKSSFNTVNGIRVHAICYVKKVDAGDWGVSIP